jgi:AAA15 family ATPase/GTPase
MEGEDGLGDLLDVEGEVKDFIEAYEDSDSFDRFLDLVPRTLNYDLQDLKWLYDELENGAFG